MKANPLNVENRSLFHADNLDVLRGINSNSIHLIATDPPFNKNRDFHATPDSLASGASFQDRWSWEKDVHQEWVDQITDDFPKLMEAIESARYAHSDGMGAYMCFMAVRLLEMKRILREDGSIYLHCDPTASHYLKAIMDAIFGYRNFRNQIVWCYKSGGASPKRKFSSKHDVILYFSQHPQDYVFNPQSEKSYNRELKPYRFKGVKEYQDATGWYTLVGMKDYWNLDMVGRTSGERTGYPTQKPLALYERIIRASSNECDIVLDPFCGCATTLVAAERLNRQWIGIDIWDKAHETVIRRLQDEGLAAPDGDTGGRLFTAGQIAYSKEPPVRTDEGEEAVPHFQTVTKRNLPTEAWQKFSRAQMTEILKEGQQYQKDAREVICAGCGRILEPEFMELDHIQPRADNGANDISNRILLCRPCNGRKSNQLTLSGLIRANKKEGWMSDEDMAKRAQASAKNKYEEIRYGPGK